MNRKQYTLMIVLALTAGLVGGVLSSQFFMGQPVFAEKKTKPKKVIEAEEFQLVDKSGKIHATLKLSGEPEQPELELVASTDANYKTVLSPGMLWLQDGKNATRRYLSIHSGLHQIKEGYGIVELDVDGLKLFDRSGGDSRVWLLKEGSLHLTGQAPMLSIQRFGSMTGIESGFIGNKPSLRLYENNETRAVVGAIDLKSKRTGEVRKRPISSMILFDEKGNVVWEAP